MHEFYAIVLEVHDGDSVKLDIDQDFDEHAHPWMRLVGIQAPELSKPGGLEARDALMGQLPVGTMVHVRSFKTQKPIPKDKYGGRWDAVLSLLVDGVPSVNLNEWMVANGYAVPWDGKGTKP